MTESGRVIRVTPITANAQAIFDAVLVGEAAAADQGCGYADEGIGMFGLALVAAVQAPVSSESGGWVGRAARCLPWQVLFRAASRRTGRDGFPIIRLSSDHRVGDSADRVTWIRS